MAFGSALTAVRTYGVKVARVARNTAGSLLDFVYPPVCFSCGILLEVPDQMVCPACMARMRRTSPEDRDFVRTFAALQKVKSISQLIVPYYFEREGPLQALIHQLKYRGKRNVGLRLGQELAQSVVSELRPAPDHPAGNACDRSRDLAEAPFPGENFMLIPVPLHMVRLRERGFNQAEMICRGIHEATGIPVMGKALTRARRTRTQIRLTPEKREANVSGAFQLLPRAETALKGKCVLLVDDVITTGATVRACASALAPCGVTRVIACAVGLAR